MADKKKKKSGPTLSGKYKVSGKKPTGKDIEAQAIADIQAEYNFVGDNWNVNPYIKGSGYKGPTGKLQGGINTYGIKAGYNPTTNTFIRARGSMGPKGENKQGGVEAGFTWKHGGLVIKDKQYLKGK
tara:strand:- start:618 stop:998 length:381 start_codon:yes stop_codon:yes gene_type:complete